MKVLLLGTSESGKSALTHQVRIIHGTNFSEDELLGFKCSIRASLLKIFAKHLHNYLTNSSMARFSIEQQEQYSNFINQLNAASKRENAERKFLDFTIEVWKEHGFQNYIFNTFDRKRSQAPSTLTRSGDDDIAENGKMEQEAIKHRGLSSTNPPMPYSGTGDPQKTHEDDTE